LNPIKLNDHTLIEQYQNGDYKAFETIYTRYRSWVVKVLSAQGMNVEDAADTCQEIFVSLLKSLRIFDFQSPFKAYLNTLIRNKLVDHYRKDRKKIVPLFLSSQVISINKKNVDDWELSSFLNLKNEFSEQFEIEDVIQHCLKFVKNPRWQSMVVLWLQGYKQKGISKVLDMPIGSVSSGLARAKTLFIGCIRKNLLPKN